MYYLLDAEERANKAAYLLAVDRYRSQLAPWVRTSKVRLTYAATDIQRIVMESAEETGGDPEYVASRLDSYIADAVAVSEPEHTTLKYEDSGKGYPPERDSDASPLEGEIQHTDILDSGEVPGAGAAEATEPSAKVDLGTDTDRTSCFRCGKLSATLVCQPCTHDLQKLAVDPYDSSSTAPDVGNFESPATPDSQMRCDLCFKEGRDFRGSPEEVTNHIQTEHQDVLNGQSPQPGVINPQNPAGSSYSKVALDENDRTPTGMPKPVNDVPSSPADQFDSMVQQLANLVAAQQFSSPDNDEIQQIASTYGLDAQEVAKNLIITSVFGNYNATNGKLSDDVNVTGDVTELPDFGGRIDSHEAIIPVNDVVNRVAQQTGDQPNFIYAQLRDKYGDDLGDKYHAAVTGENHFYLPSSMVPDQEPQDQQAQPQQQQLPPPPQQQPQQQPVM